jgi:hypothetical protein
MPGAESYRVVVYDASFRELLSTVVTDTLLTIPESSLVSAWDTANTLQWEVEALRHGDVVIRSDPGVLHRP